MTDEAAIECAVRAFCHDETAETTDPFWHGEMRLVIDALVSEGHMVPASQEQAARTHLGELANQLRREQDAAHSARARLRDAEARGEAAEAELVALREQLAEAVELLKRTCIVPGTQLHDDCRAFLSDLENLGGSR